MRHLAYEATKRAVDLLVALALLAIAVPLAALALVPARRGLLPRLAATMCAGRGGRPFALRREVLGGQGGRLRWLADWPV
ncbi:MAG: hypothetical protein JSW31_01850, partial [Burkholderiales bacterium]